MSGGKLGDLLRQHGVTVHETAEPAAPSPPPAEAEKIDFGGATKIVLRREKKGRGGKTVTVVYGLPDNAEFLKELSQKLKRACGTGGTVVEGGVELQGDLRPRVRDVLAQRGYVVKEEVLMGVVEVEAVTPVPEP